MVSQEGSQTQAACSLPSALSSAYSSLLDSTPQARRPVLRVLTGGGLPAAWARFQPGLST